MTLKNKVIATIFAIIIIVFSINTWKLKHQINVLNKTTIAVKQDADLRIGRAETLTTDAQNKIKLMDQQIQDDIKKHQALVEMYADLQAKYAAKGSGTITVPGPVREVYVTQEGKPLELHNMPFTFDDFRLHVTGDAITKDFKYTLNQNFEVQIAQAKDKTGQYQDYAELYELDSGINRINKLEITKFQVIKSSNIEKAKFRWWDLKLDLGIDYIVLKSLNHSFGGDLGLSFMSYGKSTGLTWRFIRIFAGVNTADLIYGLTPVMYNIASPLPVVSNIWLGPILGRTFNTHENFLGFGISAIL